MPAWIRALKRRFLFFVRTLFFSGSTNSTGQRDASLSSFILFLLLLCIGLSMSVAKWMANLNELPDLVTAVRIFHTLLLLLTSIVLCGLLKRPLLADRSAADFPAETDGDQETTAWQTMRRRVWLWCQKLRRLFKYHVSLVGLIVFCLPGLLIDCIKVIADFQCINAFYDNDYLIWALTDIVYHILRVVFLVLTLVFTFNHYTTSFSSCPRIWYTIHLSLCTLITLGGDILLHDILEGLTDRHFTLPVHVTNKDTHNLTNSAKTNATGCLIGDSTVFNAYSSAADNFYSLNVEFVVLGTEAFIHIIKHIGRTTPPPSTPMSPQPSAAELFHVGSLDVPVTCKNIRISNIVMYILSSLVCITYISLASLTSKNIYTPFRVMRFFMHLFQLIAFLVAICASIDFTQTPKKHTSFEKVVMFSCIGNIGWSLMNLFGEIFWSLYYNIGGQISPSSVFFGITSNILNIIVVSVQVLFLSHCSRVVPQTAGSSQHRRFTVVLLCAALLNLTEWGINSFVLNKDTSATQVPGLYFNSTTWIIVVHLTIPLALFFRFNSFALLLKTFFTQKYSNQQAATQATDLVTLHVPIH